MPGRGQPWKFGKGVKDRIGTDEEGMNYSWMPGTFCKIDNKLGTLYGRSQK